MDWARVHLGASLLGFVLAAAGFLGGSRTLLWPGVALLVLAQIAPVAHVLRHGLEDEGDDDVSGWK